MQLVTLKVSNSIGMEAAKVEVSFFLSCLFPGFSILSLTPSQSTTIVSSRPVSRSLSSRDREDKQSVYMCVCMCVCVCEWCMYVREVGGRESV